MELFFRLLLAQYGEKICNSYSEGIHTNCTTLATNLILRTLSVRKETKPSIQLKKKEEKVFGFLVLGKQLFKHNRTRTER